MAASVQLRQEITVTLYVSNCANCGILFGIPEDYETKRREDHASFYCPNGHSLSFARGETKEQMRKRLEREAANARQDAEWYRERLGETERSRNALRGVVTRQRNRAHAGACPFGCRRHFANLERHVATRHPGEKLEGEE